MTKPHLNSVLFSFGREENFHPLTTKSQMTYRLPCALLSFVTWVEILLLMTKQHLNSVFLSFGREENFHPPITLEIYT